VFVENGQRALQVVGRAIDCRLVNVIPVEKFLNHDLHLLWLDFADRPDTPLNGFSLFTVRHRIESRCILFGQVQVNGHRFEQGDFAIHQGWNTAIGIDSEVVVGFGVIKKIRTNGLKIKSNFHKTEYILVKQYPMSYSF